MRGSKRNLDRVIIRIFRRGGLGRALMGAFHLALFVNHYGYEKRFSDPSVQSIVAVFNLLLLFFFVELLIELYCWLAQYTILPSNCYREIDRPFL